MFPTLFNVTAIGISNIISAAILTISPFVAQIAFPIPMIIFTILNVWAGLCSVLLHEDPEEKDKEEQ